MKNAIKHPLYSTWHTMKNRCLNPNATNYKNYGGRGIQIADEWINNFEMFAYHMGDKPSPNHSLDRVDNDWGYYPENCRWASSSKQQQNSRSIINAKGYIITARGKYEGRVRVGGKRLYLGIFDTPEEASAVYQKFKTEFYG